MVESGASSFSRRSDLLTKSRNCAGWWKICGKSAASDWAAETIRTRIRFGFKQLGFQIPRETAASCRAPRACTLCPAFAPHSNSMPSPRKKVTHRRSLESAPVRACGARRAAPQFPRPQRRFTKTACAVLRGNRFAALARPTPVGASAAQRNHVRSVAARLGCSRAPRTRAWPRIFNRSWRR